MKIRHHGLHRHRFKLNPLEQRFADAWEEKNNPPGSNTPTLAHLLSSTKDPVEFNQNEATVAATIIQWLGSHVGQCFLAEVIATREGAELRTRIEQEVQKVVNEGTGRKSKKRASTLYPEED